VTTESTPKCFLKLFAIFHHIWLVTAINAEQCAFKLSTLSAVCTYKKKRKEEETKKENYN